MASKAFMWSKPPKAEEFSRKQNASANSLALEGAIHNANFAELSAKTPLVNRISADNDESNAQARTMLAEDAVDLVSLLSLVRLSLIFALPRAVRDH